MTGGGYDLQRASLKPKSDPPGGKRLVSANTTAASQPDLDALLKRSRLSPAQISRARALIALEPVDRQPGLWEQLQEKVTYRSQRDNASTDNGANQDNMCNVTALAMCLEFLGITNPGVLDGQSYPQFEDYLEALRARDDLGERTDNGTLKKLALKMGAQSYEMVIWKENVPRKEWERLGKQHLSTGAAILLCIGGHFVRVQGIDPQGLVVDDPYGAITLAPSRDVDSNHWSYGADAKNDAGVASTKGENNVWTWSAVEAHMMKFGVAIR